MIERTLDVGGQPVTALFDVEPTPEDEAFVIDFLRAALAHGAPLADRHGKSRQLEA